MSNTTADRWSDRFDPSPDLSHVVIVFDHKAAKFESSAGISVFGCSKQCERAKKENNTRINTIFISIPSLCNCLTVVKTKSTHAIIGPARFYLRDYTLLTW